MGKLNTSSNWKLAAVYGGFAVAAVNPIAGLVFAAACYKVKKKLEGQEQIENEIRSADDRRKFQDKFYERQNFSSYTDYLSSDTWRQKRGAILKRANGICEKPNCARLMVDVHHIWYPKVWGQEPLTALIGLCKDHHDEEHKPRF